MHPATRSLAKVSTRAVKPLPANLQVLGPIPLYRRLLRAHRKYLPPAARVIGDSYVKAEFRRTKDTENPVHIIGFLTSWQEYCQQVEGEHWKDPKINAGLIEKLSDEQIGQMYELMRAVTGDDDEDDEDIEYPKMKH